jgi:hypothetical protein
VVVSFICEGVRAVLIRRPVYSLLVAPLFLLFSCLYLFVPTAAFAAGDTNMSSCLNEPLVGFSSSLPDCRAYELVSPGYGAGATPYGYANRGVMISPDGEDLLATVFGSLQGSEGLKQVETEEGELYEFARTSTGWSVEAQDPPQGTYPFHAFQAAPASDLSSSVWVVPLPLPAGTEPETFWKYQNDSEYVLREGHNRFTEIGPVVAPGHEAVFGAFGGVKGVSEDLAHIVFSVQTQGGKDLWPGDETLEDNGHESLYEYHGTTGGEPVLVGVKNGGVPPWRSGATVVNEGAQLESDCGTDYDGMSLNGERVFFTALHEEGCTGSQPEASEIFARVNGAETVSISEPSRESCEACTLGGMPESATFVGSSEDGLLAYFTSEQHLLPGASGLSLYEYDFHAPEGKRVTLVAGELASVARASADGGRVYFESRSLLTSAGNGDGEVASAGAANLYMYNASGAAPVFQFVADGEGAGEFDATRDGQFLVFSTATELRGTNDTSEVPQLFEYDAATGSLSRVSIGERSSTGYPCPATNTIEEGYDCDGNTKIAEDTPRLAEPPVFGKITGGAVVSSVAENGTVAFSSELPLTRQAVQGHRYYNDEGILQGFTENVYEYRDGSVYLISAGDEAYPAHARAAAQTAVLGIDETGSDIFFSTVNRLTQQDTNTQSSWYDAREEGGFPKPPMSPECDEECQGAGPPPPSTLSPPLSSPTLDENIVPVSTSPRSGKQKTPVKLKKASKRCSRGYRRTKKGRCIKTGMAKKSARRVK